MQQRDSIILYINGHRHTVSGDKATKSLATYLHDLGLHGTKVVCDEGGCGACTVTLTYWEGPADSGRLIHKAVNSCITPLIYCDHAMVLTTEGLNKDGSIHPIQRRLATHHASQCGYCTPGFVMTAFTKLLNDPNATFADMYAAIESNLCRCTGYRPILEAMRSMVDDNASRGDGTLGEREWGKISVEYPYDIPDEIKEPLQTLRFNIDSPVPHFCSLLFRPANYSDALDILDEYPNAKVAMGFSEHSITKRAFGREPEAMVTTWRLSELQFVRAEDDGIHIGSAMTIANLKSYFTNHFESVRSGSFIARFKRFASPQVRATATIGGNVCHAHPVSDTLPIFLAADAIFVVESKKGGQRKVSALEWIKGFCKSALQPGEILREIVVPPEPTEEVKFHAMSYKLSRRWDDDIASIGGAFEMAVDNDLVIIRARLAYSSAAATTIRVPEIESFLEGKKFTASLILDGAAMIRKKLEMPENVPGGMAKYRTEMTGTLFERFAIEMASKFWPEVAREIAGVSPEDDIDTAAKDFEPLMFEKSSATYGDTETIGGELHKSRMHMAANIQADGTASYTTTQTLPATALNAYPVYANIGHGKLITMNIDKIKQIYPDIIILTADDIPQYGHNGVGPAVKDERIFVQLGGEIKAPAEVIAVVVHKDREVAVAAASDLWKETEFEIFPSVVSLNDLFALSEDKRTELLLTERRLDHYPDEDSFEKAFKEASHVVESTIDTPEQEHFYFETHAAVAFPGEMNTLHIMATTQNPAGVQENVAMFLGMCHADVSVEVPRLGGGFGGKESTFSYACMASLAALKTGKVCSLQLTRADDIRHSGKRHPMRIYHKIAIDEKGHITAMDIKLAVMGGFSTDLTPSVLERGVFHVFGSYRVPLCRIVGRAYFSNTHSNTAFRGFGSPQTILAIEKAIDKCAETIGMDYDEFRELNFMESGDMMPYHGRLMGSVTKVWKALKEKSNIRKRQKQINTWNTIHRYRKRGICMIPVTFGITFTQSYLNQAGALVHLGKDGSLRVAHSGIEMGQGLDTKMRALAADAMDMPFEMVRVVRTNTATCPNGPPTSASSAADLNGYAIQDACHKLKQQLASTIKEVSPEGKPDWPQIGIRSWFARMPMSAYGHYASRVEGFDFKTQQGTPFAYFSFSAACIEVEVDTMTGVWHIPRADIVMDVGHSLNPAIDVGQIEGAFVQGIGYMVEEYLYVTNRNGKVPLSSGPGNYKIPSPLDIPAEFNVQLLPGSRNPRAPHSSKGVGEPPLCMGAGVYVALHRAIRSALEKDGLSVAAAPPPELLCPVTMEHVRLALLPQAGER